MTNVVQEISNILQVLKYLREMANIVQYCKWFTRTNIFARNCNCFTGDRKYLRKSLFFFFSKAQIFCKRWQILCDLTNVLWDWHFFCKRLQILFFEMTNVVQEIANILHVLKYFTRDGKYYTISQMIYKNEELQIFCERFHVLQERGNVV